jgi:transposase
MAEELIEHAQGDALIADAGYDSNKLVEAIKAKGLSAVIANNPQRKEPRPVEQNLYDLRFNVECFFFRLKRFRRIATRYEKTARNYLGFLHLTCAMLWLS